jgi:hypothetical protein
MKVLVVLGLAASLFGCHVHKTKRGFRIGTGCRDMDESCSDGSTAHVCDAKGVLATLSCKGPGGCVDALPQPVACDQSIAEVNAPCRGDHVACTQAKDALLECKGGVFVKQSACPHGCEVKVDTAGGVETTTRSCR